MSEDVIAKANALDSSDPLAHFCDRSVLRDGLIYLNGNSLWALNDDTEVLLSPPVYYKSGVMQVRL